MEEIKILIIQTAFPGDAFLTLPMIQKLKEQFPNSLIDVVAIPQTEIIFRHSNCVNKVITFDKRGKHKSIIALIKFISFLKGIKYNRIYSPHRSFRTSSIVFFSGVKTTFGFDNSSISFVYKHKIGYNKNIHEVARNLDLIGYNIDGDNWKIMPEILIDELISKKIDQLTQQKQNNKIIAVAPGTVWQTKMYPIEYFQTIVKMLVEKEYNVVLIGGKDDQNLCEEIVQKNKVGVESFAGKLNLIESVALLKKCELLICNDSAPTHMAMSAGIKTLTIYCSTVPSFGFFPYSSNSDFISYNDLDCKPCGIHGHKNCPIKTFDCGFKLTPELVFDKFIKLLK